MHHFFDAITNNKGDALTGYYVRLVDSDGSGATLYADTSLTPIVSVSGLADAAKVDGDGNVDFYVAVGTYQLDIYATDGATLVKSISDVGLNIDADTAATAVAAQASATTSASAALNSASAAATSEANAAASEANAATSASSASSSASSASGYASTASNAANASTNAAATATSAQAGVIAALGGASIGAVNLTAATRTTLAALSHSGVTQALLGEAGREGLFVWDGSNLSAKVTADTTQGIYVAPSSDTSGASGAWVRKFSGPVIPEWFGIVAGDAAGANAVANNAAWTALVATLVTLAANATGNYRAFYDVLFGLGNYELNTLDLTLGTINIVGRGSGHVNSPNATGATKLKFYDCTGIRLQANNTSGASTKDGSTHYDAISSALRDICLEGNFDGANEHEYHGIHARTKFTARNVLITGFAGDGLRLDADTSTTGGNVCDWLGTDLYIHQCRNGIYDIGNNTSAGSMIGGTLNNNRQCGLFASNFLGSTWVGTEFASNGIHPANDGINIGASVVSNGGNLYGAIYGQEAGASTNAPSGTTADNTWWYYISAGSAASGKPAWFSGILVRAGGPIIDPSINSRNTYIGCYSEQTGGKCQIYQRSLVVGGMLSQWIWQNTDATSHECGILYGDAGSVNVPGAFVNVSGGVTAQLGAQQGNANRLALIMTDSAYAPSGYRYWFRSTNQDLYFSYTTTSTFANVAYEITGPTTTEQGGTGAAIPHSLIVPRLYLGDSNSGMRQVGLLGAVPTTGAHGQGEFYFQRGATAGLIGWHCTASGSPGTWEALYSGYGTNNIGYATGAGGTVTQATNKSTGVTLNKLSGQVTLNGAALGSAAKVSFVVTNSQCAATDTPIVSVASGGTANAYRASVTAVAAGSFTVTLENITAGSLSETPVINFALIKAVNA